MRSIGLLAVATGTLVLASACSEGSGVTPPENEAPVAIFTMPPCTIDVACTFASSSTDDEQVTRWSWDFDDDGAADASTPCGRDLRREQFVGRTLCKEHFDVLPALYLREV